MKTSVKPLQTPAAAQGLFSSPGTCGWREVGNGRNKTLPRGVRNMPEMGNNCPQALPLWLPRALPAAAWERKQLYYDYVCFFFFFFKSENIIAQGFGGQEEDLRLL